MDGIAIIGMAGRFPGADTLEQFWQNLCQGVESITVFDDATLRAEGVSPELIGQAQYVKARGVVNQIDLFDAAFFGYTPREAEALDPQQRVFLECAWEAFEHAGYDSAAYQGLVGVYGGIGLHTYLLFNLMTNPRFMAAVGDDQIELANENDYLATRVSYKLNLHGPSISVQTACSTSLVAVHLACQSLLSYQCDLALAGGVSIRLPLQSGYLHQPGGVLSPDGHCRAFDQAAQGTVPGSGCGTVVLKRLEDALADGDTIYAVIRGTAINNDGSQKVGYTAPSVEGQADVIRMAQAVAQVTPDTISYIEAHGTGTALGDPIEIAALTQVFREHTAQRQFCAIGALKTNIGHLDTASGVAGLIKTALALHHRQLPPSLHFSQPNAAIPFASSPFYVNTALQPWPDSNTPRRAGVSSFGIGGTNAHAVLEEAPPAPASDPSQPWQLLVLSAKTGPALEQARVNLASALEQSSGELADIAYTLQVGRHGFTHRLALVCQDRASAVAALRQADSAQVLRADQETRQRPVVFMFPGQGAQYRNMGLGLYQTEPIFRDEIDRCAALLLPLLGLDLRTVLYPGDDAATDLLEQTWLTQPALFVVEYALAQLWIACGFKPQALIGHSIGEYVAATLAGVFTLEAALQLVVVRGRLMQELPRGAMLVVPLPEEDVRARLIPDVTLAAINAASHCVVSGPLAAVERFEQQLAAASVDSRRLHTSHAFHSAMMDPILTTFTEYVARTTRQRPQIPLISGVTGDWISPEMAVDPAYWAEQLRQPVRFASGLRLLIEEHVLIEVGPGNTLTTFARQQPGFSPALSITSMRHAREHQPDRAAMLQALARLWLAGLPLDWSQLYQQQRRRRVALPTYPFERQRYWVAPQSVAHAADSPATLHKQPTIDAWTYVPSWRRSAHVLSGWPDRSEQAVEEWLVFIGADVLGPELVQQLVRAGQRVTQVHCGGHFAQRDPRSYSLNPAQPQDYDRLWQALQAAGAFPQRIVHAWSVLADGPSPTSEAALQDRGFYSLLFLAQAIGRLSHSAPLQIDVVTNSLQPVTGDEVRWPTRATLLGPCKVIPREYPQIRCRTIDVVLAGPAQRLAAQVLGELLTPCAEPQVALRGLHRWTPTFEPVPLTQTEPSLLRDGGVYLITGGLGGVGLVLAARIARTVRARLVLVGRTGLPPRETWAAADTDAVTARRIRAVQALEELGAEVLILAADITDEPALRAAIQAAQQRFGPLNGVIHAAGVPAGGIIQLKTPELAAQVLAPKVAGTLALVRALEAGRLDFMILCSSLSAILGEFGQAEYVAANAFLDLFAHYHQAQTGYPTIAINWDVWQAVGMAADVLPAVRETHPPAQPALTSDHPLLDRCLSRSAQRALYETDLSVGGHWLLNEHRIAGQAVLPGTAYLELALAAFIEYVKAGPVVLHDVVFVAPLVVPDDEPRQLRTVIARHGDRYRVTALSADRGGGWQEHMHAELTLQEQAEAPIYPLEAVRQRCQRGQIDVTPTMQAGIEHMYYGPRWMNITHVLVGDQERLATLELAPEFSADLERYLLHPALLDVATSLAMYQIGTGFYLPLSYTRLTMYRPLTGRLYSHIIYRTADYIDKATIHCDIVITDADGRLLVTIDEFSMIRVDVAEAFAPPAAAPRSVDPEVSPAAAVQAALLTEGMLPDEGAEVLERVLSTPVGPQVIVATRDLAALIAYTDSLTSDQIEQVVAEPLAAAHTRPALQTVYVAPRSAVEEQVAAVWQSMLGIEPIGVHDNFFELGGHSLLAIQVMSRLRTMFELDLPLGNFFETPTVAGVAQVIQANQPQDEDPEELARLLAEIEGLSPAETQAILSKELQQTQDTL